MIQTLMKKENKSQRIRKTIVALIAGWGSVYFANYAIDIDNLYNLKVVWSLLFPMLISMAWRPIYGLIAGTAGLTFLVPFIAYPGKGIGNILLSLTIVLVLWLNGFVRQYDQNGRSPLRNMYLIQFLVIGFYASITFLFFKKLIILNPFDYFEYQMIRYIPDSILRIQTLNTAFVYIMICSICSALLALPGVRGFFRLHPLKYADKNVHYFTITLITIIVASLADSLVDKLYTSIKGLHMSFLITSTGGYLKISIVVAVAFIICNYVTKVAMQDLAAKSKLVDSEERYRLIFENMVDVYFETTPEGVIKNTSPSVANVFGYTQSYMNGINIKQILFYQDSADKMLQALQKKGSISNFEAVGRKSNNTKVYLLLEGNCEPDPKSNEERFIIMARDVTDYTNAEHDRINLSANLAALFEAYEDFVWTVDGANHTVISYNKKFNDYIGEERGIELKTGTRMADIVRPETIQLWESYLERVYQQGSFQVEYDLDNNGRFFEICFFPIVLYNEKKNIAIIEKDITEKKKVEKELLQWNNTLEQRVNERTLELESAYKDLEAFSHTISHELRTPIREIEAYIECIDEDNREVLNQQSKKDLEDIKQICADTIELIQEMMEYSKAGYTVMKHEEINMEKLVRECFEKIRMVNENKPLDMVLYSLPALSGDYLLIKQAVFNIIANSAKYTKNRPDPRITVGCFWSEDKYCYYFRDNGVGFEPSLSGKLFTLFERAHSHTDFEGNGIGLATVKKIVERHGGVTKIMGECDKGCTVLLEFKRQGKTSSASTL